MGLLNARNLRKAKDLLEKNRHKVGDVVEKAGDTLDKVSKGKTSSVTAKASDAAKKYSEGASPRYGTEFEVDDETRRATVAHDSADAKLRQSQATETAANAVKGAADALTNMMNKAAAHADRMKDAEKIKDTEKIKDAEKIRDAEKIEDAGTRKGTPEQP